MYRALTLKILRSGLDGFYSKKIGAIAETTRIELVPANGSLKVLLDGEDVTEQIRSPEVTIAVSSVSTLRDVRQAMVREQRRLGKDGGVVLEGRDLGTVVFPDADVKIFMVASIEARARRRQQELLEKGIRTDLETLMNEIRERDEKDYSRDESPLRKADDAIVLDTSDLTIDEQVEFVVRKAQEKLAEQDNA